MPAPSGSAALPGRTPPPVLALLLGLLFCLTAPGAAQDPARSASADRSNVVVILIDALRADHVGTYGYARNTTPEIDRLSEEALLFESAFSQAGWTKPSIPTLFTGLHPIQHLVFAGSADDTPGRITSDLLADTHVTLAEAFAAAGCATGAFVENAQIRSFLGFDQGFDVYAEDLGAAGEITAAFLAWLDRKPDGPFFAYIHYVDPHWPYTPPAPYHRLFPTPSAGTIDFSLADWKSLEWQIETGEVKLEPADIEAMRALYDGEIRYVDDSVGKLLDGLRARGLYDRTLIVVTADHGEEFMEHDHIGHGNHLYDELLHIPLILRIPGFGHARIPEQVGLVDVMPTLLDLTGISIPEGVAGRSLRPLIEGKRWIADFAFADHRTYGPSGRIQQSIRTSQEKLIRTFAVQDSLPPTARTPRAEIPLIEPGQWLEVEGVAQGDGRFLALEIEPTESLDEIKLYGPVQSPGPTPGSFMLLGTRCLLLPHTRFKDVAGNRLDGLALEEGLWIQAKGVRNSEGALEVSRIKLLGEEDFEEEVKAPVEEIQKQEKQTLLTLGGFIATVDEHTHFDGEWAWPAERMESDRQQPAERTAPPSAEAPARILVAVELYDLQLDPGEQENIAERHPERVAELLALLDAWEQQYDRTHLGVERVPLDERTIEKLRSLGYVR